MDYALRDYEDAYDYDSAAVDAQQMDLVAHALAHVPTLIKTLETASLDLYGQKEVRINGGRYCIGDALVIAAFAGDEQRSVILNDCRAAIVRVAVADGLAEVL